MADTPGETPRWAFPGRSERMSRARAITMVAKRRKSHWISPDQARKPGRASLKAVCGKYVVGTIATRSPEGVAPTCSVCAAMWREHQRQLERERVSDGGQE